MLLMPALSGAIETAPPLSDREVIERLTRVEEGQKALQQEMQQLRTDMNMQMQQLRQEVSGQIQQLRQEVSGQIQQLRTEMQQLRQDMNAQFSYVFQLMVGMLGAFAAIVAVTISFALWDRRTMIRPFESKVKVIEEELSQNRQRFHALLEALRVLGQKDKQVADVLKKFDLL